MYPFAFALILAATSQRLIEILGYSSKTASLTIVLAGVWFFVVAIILSIAAANDEPHS